MKFKFFFIFIFFSSRINLNKLWNLDAIRCRATARSVQLLAGPFIIPLYTSIHRVSRIIRYMGTFLLRAMIKSLRREFPE